jgi:hypothetical protein
VAIVQLTHGMVEFIDRYDGFADYLTGEGMVSLAMITWVMVDRCKTRRTGAILPIKQGTGSFSMISGS